MSNKKLAHQQGRLSSVTARGYLQAKKGRMTAALVITRCVAELLHAESGHALLEEEITGTQFIWP